MATTAKGIRYPLSSEHKRIWEHLQNLANDTDSLLDKHIGRDTGPAAQTDYTTAATAASVTVNVLNGHIYLIKAYVLGTQITATGNPVAKILDAAAEFSPSARLAPLAGGLALTTAAGVMSGYCEAYFVASSSTSKTFNLQIQDTVAGAFRVTADAAWILVVDAGIA